MKDQALTLVKIALQLFPPLAKLIGKAIQAFTAKTPEEKALVEEVRSILPGHTPLHDLVRDLENEERK